MVINLPGGEKGICYRLIADTTKRPLESLVKSLPACSPGSNLLNRRWLWRSRRWIGRQWSWIAAPATIGIAVQAQGKRLVKVRESIRRYPWANGPNHDGKAAETNKAGFHSVLHCALCSPCGVIWFWQHQILCQFCH